jgi:hypothetical protein
VKVVFSSLFKQDLREAVVRYAKVSPKLGEEFTERVKESVRTILRWGGGDHVGIHGFPCRKCRPFPYLIYCEIKGDSLFVLGLVHERQRPDYLSRNLPVQD